MITISSTRARQQWAQTLDQAKRAPVAITEHGRETVVLMDADLGRRALEALEDAEDAQEAAEILSRIKSGQERTYTLAEVADAPTADDALEDAQDVAAFDAAMAEEGENIPWAQVEAEEQAQRADRMDAFAKLREMDEALEEPE
jgi:prevent-host-death family protein